MEATYFREFFFLNVVSEMLTYARPVWPTQDFFVVSHLISEREIEIR